MGRRKLYPAGLSVKFRLLGTAPNSQVALPRWIHRHTEKTTEVYEKCIYSQLGVKY